MKKRNMNKDKKVKIKRGRETKREVKNKKRERESRKLLLRSKIIRKEPNYQRMRELYHK